MPTSILDFADQVVADLTDAPAGTFAHPFDAARTFQPRFDLEKDSAAGVKVFVMPTVQIREAHTRADEEVQVKIDVGIAGRVANLSGGGDEMVKLGESIARYFRRRDVLDGTVTQIEHLILFSPEQLETKGVLVNVLRMTIRHIEDVDEDPTP